MEIKNVTIRNIQLSAPHGRRDGLPETLVLIAGTTHEIDDEVWEGFEGSVTKGNIKNGKLVLVKPVKLSKKAQDSIDEKALKEAEATVLRLTKPKKEVADTKG